MRISKENFGKGKPTSSKEIRRKKKKKEPKIKINKEIWKIGSRSQTDPKGKRIV